MFIIPQFMPVYQNQHMTELLAKLATPFDVETQRASIRQEQSKKERIKIISRPSAINTAALLLLLSIVVEYTKNQSTILEIPLSRYYALRGVKELKFMRRQIDTALEYLDGIKFSIFDGHSRAWMDIHIFAKPPEIKNKAIYITLNQDIKKLMPRQKVMLLPASTFNLFKGEKSVTRALLLWRICQHKRINNFNDAPFSIPVKTLLETCSNLPRYDELDRYRHLDREIIMPFENALDRCDALFSWEYETGDNTGWWEFIENKIIIRSKDTNIPKNG